uniref:Matrix protein n=1 Tax=Tongren Rhabd tick virus 3 TaxID=2972337 RepID=A0A9E7V2D4_9RHAB|nr:MAG: matrix protein [Tongren Rhabd tick virus 3]
MLSKLGIKKKKSPRDLPPGSASGGSTPGTASLVGPWVSPFADLPTEWEPTVSPSAPPPGVSHVVFDLSTSLLIRAPRELSPRLIAEMSQNFPDSYRGDHKSRVLAFTWMAHHVVSVKPMAAADHGTKYYSEVKECVLFSGEEGGLPCRELHRVMDTFQWRYKGEVYEWVFRLEAHPTVMSGLPLHKVLSPRSAQVIRAFGLNTSFHKNPEYLEVMRPRVPQ